MNRFLEETLASTKAALPRFRYVKIDFAQLGRVAEKDALKDFVLPRWDSACVQPQSHGAFPSHCFWGSAINFCFDNSNRSGDGKLIKFSAHGRNGYVLTGSYAMQSRFYGLFGENDILADDLAPYIETFSRFKKTFHGINSMPLLKMRWKFLRECADTLQKHFDGDVFNLLEEGGYRAFGGRGKSGVVELLLNYFPATFGADWFVCNKECFSPPLRKFYFYFDKRAQLFALMYHGRAVASKGALRTIADVEDIGPIADYILPKRYAEDGVLLYGPELEEKIKRALPIERHSQEEIEIRAATVFANWTELQIVNEMRLAKGLPLIHAGHLDYYRWCKRSKDKSLNHHLTTTTDY